MVLPHVMFCFLGTFFYDNLASVYSNCLGYITPLFSCEKTLHQHEHVHLYLILSVKLLDILLITLQKLIKNVPKLAIW